MQSWRGIANTPLMEEPFRLLFWSRTKCKDHAAAYRRVAVVPYGCHRKLASLKNPDGCTVNEIHAAVSVIREAQSNISFSTCVSQQQHTPSNKVLLVERMLNEKQEVVVLDCC